jgi:hypothetical protein
MMTLTQGSGLLHKVLVEDVCDAALSRTKDPIFQIPRLLVVLAKLDDKAAAIQLGNIVTTDVLDNTIPEFIAELLAESRPEVARYAYERSLAILDERRKKYVLHNKPFSHSTLLEDYDVLAEQLEPLYDILNDTRANNFLQAKLNEVNTDKQIKQLERTDKLGNGTDAILERDHPDSSILA